VPEAERVRRILHCDMDCYYAAVHVRDDPALAGRPVVVGGDPGGRGVVATASYEARRYGIHSAMPAARARRLCPNTVFLAPDFPRYRRESERIFAIYREITPDVETVSLDEAYLDVTDHLGAAGTASEVAQEIRRRVRAERGLTVSVGVGPNCLVAKIASDACKPDGLKVVPPARVRAFLDPLPVRRLHGVGPATERALAAMDEQLDAMAREVATGLVRRDIAACTVTLKARYPDFTTVTRSLTFRVPTADSGRIGSIAKGLLRRSEAARKGVRLLGVSVSTLVPATMRQLELFGEA
jgi:nucleotidyltransferase/DNA polymerase involved in DNA repair